MTFVQLTPHIRYIPLSDGEGDFGLLINHVNDTIVNTVEVYDREQFTDAFNRFVAYTEVVA